MVIFLFSDNPSMKKILVLFCLLSTTLSTSAQTFTKEGESMEIKSKYPNADFLGSDNENYYAVSYNLDNKFIFDFLKVNKNSLSKVSQQQLTVEFQKFHYLQETGACDLNVFFRQDKIYIIYGLLDTEGSTADFRIYMKVLNKNFEIISDEQIGHIVDTGYEKQGSYEVVLSPDGKTALVVMKNLCEKKKAFGYNMIVFENTELVWIDLASGKKTFSKFLPIEDGDKRIKTSQYKLANNGNLTFILMHYPKSDHRTTFASYIGINKFKKEDIEVNEIKFNSTDSIVSNSLTQLPNEKVIYLFKTKNRYIYKIINVSDGKVELEKEYSLHKSKDGELETDVKEIFESDKHFYFLSLGHISTPFYYEEYMTAYKLTKEGEFVWARVIPKKTANRKAYRHIYSKDYFDVKAVLEKDTLKLVFLEHMDKQPIQTGNTFDCSKQIYTDGNPIVKSNVVSYNLSPAGNVSKKIIIANTKDLGISPYNGYPTLPDNTILLNFCGPKTLKFATLKL